MRGLVVQSTGADADPAAQSVENVIARRAEFLTAYQHAAYAQRYLDRIAAVRAA
jgi:indolepyruvate ferredoxin oxidoreductase